MILYVNQKKKQKQTKNRQTNQITHKNEAHFT